MTDPLDDMLDIAGQHARKVLIDERCERLLPIALMIDGAGNRLLAPLEWDNEAEKVMLLHDLRAFMRARGVTRYSMISEAWAARQKGRDPHDGPPPSERPDRMEVVVAVAADKRESKNRMWDIVRGETGAVVKLALAPSLDDVGGRMAELLREQ